MQDWLHDGIRGRGLKNVFRLYLTSLLVLAPIATVWVLYRSAEGAFRFIGLAVTALVCFRCFIHYGSRTKLLGRRIQYVLRKIKICWDFTQPILALGLVILFGYFSVQYVLSPPELSQPSKVSGPSKSSKKSSKKSSEARSEAFPNVPSTGSARLSENRHLTVVIDGRLSVKDATAYLNNLRDKLVEEDNLSSLKILVARNNGTNKPEPQILVSKDFEEPLNRYEAREAESAGIGRLERLKERQHRLDLIEVSIRGSLAEYSETPPIFRSADNDALYAAIHEAVFLQDEGGSRNLYIAINIKGINFAQPREPIGSHFDKVVITIFGPTARIPNYIEANIYSWFDSPTRVEIERIYAPKVK